MKEYDKIPAQAVVKVTTSWGRTCLGEIGRDLKEGTVLDGYYYPVSKAFDFEWKGEGAMLWIEDNGRLVSLGEGQKHKYMMLSRLLSDCKYFLRNPYERHLYFPSIARHCKEMRQYWLELNIKPEWLSYKQIGRLEHKMNRMKTKLDRQFKKDRYGKEQRKHQENEEGHWRNGQASWYTDRQRPAAFPQRTAKQVTIYQ